MKCDFLLRWLRPRYYCELEKPNRPCCVEGGPSRINDTSTTFFLDGVDLDFTDRALSFKGRVNFS